MQKPAVLVVTTTWWNSVAMLASSLEQGGFGVTMLCPKGHAAWHARRYRCLLVDPTQPLLSLSHAIAQVHPALVIAGDDRTIHHLRLLHAEAPRDLRSLIERSIGPESSFEDLSSRVSLLQAAREVGIAVPEGRDIETRNDLDRWTSAVPGPWVLKRDGTWGGQGVDIARTHDEARRAFARLSHGMSRGMAMKRKLVNGDPFPLQDRRTEGREGVSIQRFIKGRPGNCAAFCLDGEVLGATIVEAEQCCSETGPSTLVRVVERPSFLSGVRRLVKSRRFSGFLGFDFMADEATDDAILIEMNPRITSPCRIRTAAGTDPISAAATSFGIRSDQLPPRPRTLFASFPLAWHSHPRDIRLAACQEDVPWHEPALVEEALKPLWPERGPVACFPAKLRALGRRISNGARIVDYRAKPITWWVGEGLLLPPNAAHPLSVGASGASPRRFNAAGDAALPAP